LADMGYGVPYPSSGFPEARVFFPRLLQKKMERLNRMDLPGRFEKYTILPDEINDKSKHIVMTVRTSMSHEIKKIQNLCGAALIYSMWEGYKEAPSTGRFLSNCVNRGASITTIHTSGHADYYTLRQTHDTLQPKELVPIHTLDSKQYREIFSNAAVHEAINGEIISRDNNSFPNMEEMSLLQHIEEIGKAHENSGALPQNGFEDFAEKVKHHLDFVCSKLGLNEMQAILLSDMVYIFDGFEKSIANFAQFIGCKTIKILNCLNIFKELEDKEFIQIDESSDPITGGVKLSFNIKEEVLSALQEGVHPQKDTIDNLSFDDFFLQLAKLYEDCVQRGKEYISMLKKLNSLMENNKHLDITKKIKSYMLSTDDESMLFRFCHYLVNLDEESMDFRQLGAICRFPSDFAKTKRQLKSGSHVLLEKGLIQNVNDGGFSIAESFCLTDKAKDELLAEYESRLSNRPLKGIKPASDIPEKMLFYPEKASKQIAELTNLLREENFNLVQKRMLEEKMRTGFACLFSGSPGTGKTETAYQLARLTGRGIMQVDISDTKSMWFGESEKKIKEVFTRYRSAVKRSSIIPILLFNEADAVIGKRQNLGENRNGPGQTENTIQNIILQEIENLNGIFIATTNLVKNMDKAFERRFLYKIEFEKPSFEVRKSIWLVLIPDLPDDEADTLAEKFNFSGGQIENIARRRTVANVLNGSMPSLDALIRYCEDEMSENTGSRRIGF
jgi:hypothetical protein